MEKPIHFGMGTKPFVSEKIEVEWVKRQNGEWYPLNSVDLKSAYFNFLAGIYLIFTANPGRNVVTVGQGTIKECLADHRLDNAITSHRKFGPLYVTWAELSPPLRDGVEKFLIENYNPFVAGPVPDGTGIAVNPPYSGV